MALPGQAPSTEDLKANFPSMQVLLSSGVEAELMFPSAQSVGLGLVTVLDQLRVQRVVALGDGAGGSIIARYSTVQYSTVIGMSNKSIDTKNASILPRNLII